MNLLRPEDFKLVALRDGKIMFLGAATPEQIEAIKDAGMPENGGNGIGWIEVNGERCSYIVKPLVVTEEGLP